MALAASITASPQPASERRREGGVVGDDRRGLLWPLALIFLAIAIAHAAAAETPPAQKSYLGTFSTSVLAGGSTNELTVPVKPENLQLFPENDSGKVAIKWDDWDPTKNTRLCPRQIESPKLSEKIVIRSKKSIENDDTKTRLFVEIPPTPCWWPLTQTARVMITANVVGNSGTSSVQTLFDEKIDISVLWFPLSLTLLVLALIYPGCSMVAFYVKQRRYEKDCADAKAKGQPKPAEPNFLSTLDPVQITANPHGRGSLAKLQIFVFSLLVFGLLLYYQLRYGVLAGMSIDVMTLMGISAVGAVGGKVTYVKNRRLSLENWAWLRRKGWLPIGYDVQPRAKWSELFLDSDTKEFDPYSFQMAVFSLVVAVALVRTGLSGLGTFKIPPELLALLGLSQAVFIGGKAAEKSGYAELDKKLDEVRQREAKFVELSHDADAKEQAKAPAELQAFRDSALQAAEMFWSVYIEQLPSRPVETTKEKVNNMTPGALGPAG